MPGLRAFGTYALYKAGQDKFTNWLKQTADKCKGNSADGERTKAKRKPGIIVHYTELETLAQTVVAETPAQDIPTGIVQTLRDVIAKRRQSSRFFSKKSEKDGDESLKKSNEGHQHIIKILENVLKLFEDKLKSKSSTAPKKEDSRGMRHLEAQMSNIFDLLEISDPVARDPTVQDEEEEEEETDAASISSKASTSTRNRGKKGKKAKSRAKKAQATRRPEPELEDAEYHMEFDEEDIYFLLYCFFEDFNEIRDFLLERWCDYADGIISLSTVAVITNTAFDMFQHEEKVLLSTLPKSFKLRDFGSIAHMLFIECGLLHVDYNNTPSDKEEANNFMQEEANWVCLPIYWFLINWLEHAPPGKIPVIPPDMRIPLDAPYGLTPIEIARKKDEILREFIAEMAVIKAMKRNPTFIIPAEDELTKGIVKFLQQRTISIWFVLACQVYVDIRYVLEGKVANGLTELQATAERVKGAINGYFEFSKDFERPSGVLKTIVGEIECWVDEDFPQEARIGVHMPHGITEDELEAYCLQKRHPILCGLMTFRYNLTMEEVGLKAANSWGGIMATAHIYNMIRQEIPEKGLVWEDMDSLIAIHTVENMFVGYLPKEPMAYLKHYGLATGAKPEMFARDYRGPPLLNGKCRELVSRAEVSNIFHDRICFNMDTNILTMANMETVLSHVDMPLPNITSQADHSRSAFFSQMAIADQVRRTQTIMPLQILDSLCQRIHDEAFLLYFNYFSMHQRCMKILRALRDRLDREIIPAFPRLDIEEEDLANLPTLIFRKMLAYSEERKDLAAKIEAVMRDVIGEEGRQEITSLMGILRETQAY
ncbi:hypothetical protein F5884DRAFT_364660 [Xylogone sp. PMI_703]|nr:hypothetical protein F5884DRAFT_364660 [Xylogone sp. PMI_703]